MSRIPRGRDNRQKKFPCDTCPARNSSVIRTTGADGRKWDLCRACRDVIARLDKPVPELVKDALNAR